MNTNVTAFRLLPLRLGITRVSVGWRFLFSLAIMAAYMVASRIIYRTEGLSFAEIEVLRTPFRLAAAVAFWLLMADVMFARPSNSAALRHPLAVLGLGLMFATPILTHAYEASTADAAVLAIASFPVALFEELFFRGILQTLLVKGMGAAQGIGLGAICFTLYHVGASNPDALNFILIIFAGAIYGLIYFKTGSILIVTLIHAVDDVLIGLPLEPVLPVATGVMFPFISFVLLLFWANRSS